MKKKIKINVDHDPILIVVENKWFILISFLLLLSVVIVGSKLSCS